MGNALVKWDEKSNKRADNTKVERALARLRDVKPDICEVAVVCAVHDKPYIVRFKRAPNGKFKYLESVKVTAGSGGASAKVTSMSMDDFDAGDKLCPWCGDRSFGHCLGYCNAFVCCGRMTGNTFRCRKSCGAVWQGVPMTEVEVSAPARASSNVQPAKGPVQPKAVKMIEAGANAGRFDFLK